MAPKAARSLLLCLALALAAEPIAAQYRTSVPGYGNFSRMRQHFSTRAAIRASQRPAPRPRAPAPQRPAPAGADTSFRPQAPEIAPALMAAEVARSAEDRRQTERNFSQLLSIYRQRLRAAGGAQNDVARAAAFLVSNSYETYFGTGPLTQAQFQLLRRQFAREFAASPAFQRKSSRERQIEFEIYAILGTALVAIEGATPERLRLMARENLVATLGVPPERLAMTENGLAIR